MRKNFSKLLDLEKIKELQKSGKSLTTISKDIGASTSVISNFLCKNGVYTKNINHYNHNYFEQINTEAKAYILGYIIADGSIIKEERKNRTSTIDRVQFQCQKEDVEILELIKREIAPQNKITTIVSKTINKKDTVRLRLASKKIVSDLINLYSISPRKTYDKTFRMPSIPEEFKKAFIVGFMDGDGSIGKRHFSMILNSPLFMEDILSEFLKEIPDLKYYKYKENRKYTDYWSLHFSVNKKSRLDLFNFLYKDTSIRLERKYLKALNSVLNSKSKELLSV